MASQQAKSRSHLNLCVPKTQIRTYWWCRACVYRKSDSAILVMKSAEDGRRYDAAHVLDCAIDRGWHSRSADRPAITLAKRLRCETHWHDPPGVLGPHHRVRGSAPAPDRRRLCCLL